MLTTCRARGGDAAAGAGAAGGGEGESQLKFPHGLAVVAECSSVVVLAVGVPAGCRFCNGLLCGLEPVAEPTTGPPG